MSSKKKSVEERLLGKTIKMLDGTEVVAQEVSEDDTKVGCLTSGGALVFLAVDEVEARGGKFFQVHLTDADLLDKDGQEENASEEVKEELVCQFCLHKYYPAEGGFKKPESSADVCGSCITLAEDRLLMAGLTGENITTEVALEYLANFYGIIRKDIVVTVNNQVSLQQLLEEDFSDLVGDENEGCNCEEGSACVEENCKCTTDAEENCCSCVDQRPIEGLQFTNDDIFLSAKSAIAHVFIASLQAMGVEAEKVAENSTAVFIKFPDFYFALTALCGGNSLTEDEYSQYMELCGTDEQISLSDISEFSSLDDLFLYFCAEDELTEEGDDETMPLLLEGSFHRLKNCKSKENNKKLVKVLKVILPEEGTDKPVLYRVVDKEGTTYKVSESKLRPSAKSF